MDKIRMSQKKEYKQHELTIDIGASSRTNIITDTTFFTMDIKTGKKVINFTLNGERLDLTDATVMLGFEFVDVETTKIIDSKDGSITIERPRRGECSVVLPNHLYQYSGPVLVHVYIMFEDGRSFDAGIIVTEFKESWLDSELEEMTEFYVKRFEDLAEEIRQRADRLQQLLEDVDSNIVKQDDFDAHVDDKSNPHAVTIGQIPNLQHELNNRSLIDHTHPEQTTITGNAGTATSLQTPRAIGGVNFDGTENINLPGVNTTGNQNTTGNAGTATKLETPRQINGTSFDGTTNITTANWGTARNIQIGNLTHSVNGAANVSWTLADIGAAPAAHNHNASNINVGTLAAARMPTVINSGTRIGQITITNSTISNTNIGTSMAIAANGNMTLTGGGLANNIRLNTGMVSLGASQMQSNGIRNLTTTSAANMRISTGSPGDIMRSTSSERYKLNINRGVSVGYATRLLDVEPATWFDRHNTEKYAELLTRSSKGASFDNDAEGIEPIVRVGGLIAEDVEKAGLETYVDYGNNGKTVEGVDYDRLWTLLIPIVRDQLNRISELEVRLKQLEGSD